MSTQSHHPEYDARAADYQQMSDTYAGERTIKEATTRYLPMTLGQIKDGAKRNPNSDGAQAYQGYVQRAVFPEFTTEAVRVLVGVLHAEPPVIELPPEMEMMRSDASKSGESLAMLLRRINEQQLLFGRIGLLADFPSGARLAQRNELPHLVEYYARAIINWDDESQDTMARDQLSFVVLDETRFVRGKAGGPDRFAWDKEDRFRVLSLQPREAAEGAVGAAEVPLGVYRTWIDADTTGEVLLEEKTPMYRGRTLDEIPFVFIGANDLDPSPDEIPLLPLSNLCLAIYRSEADYRQALHMQGQDTLIIIGEELAPDGQAKDETAKTEVGAGAVIRVQAGEGAGAKFIGIESRGIPEQRQAIDADRSRAQSMGARLLEPRGSQAESGEALKIRVAASTANLRTIALTGAEGLQRALRIVARWIGADPNAVKVTPNLDFTQETPSPETARALGEAAKTGLPLSKRSQHAWLQAANFTKRTFAEEQELIEAERIENEAKAVAEKMLGLTEDTDDHSHYYEFLRWPDGTVRGLTAVADDHVHQILDETQTEEADGHTHKLREPLPAPIAPALDAQGNPIEPDAQGGPGAPAPDSADPGAKPAAPRPPAPRPAPAGGQ